MPEPFVSCKTGEVEKPWLAKQVAASQANSTPNAFMFPRRDGDTISAYDIRNKSVIDLVVKIKVYVVTPLTQERMTLVLKPKDTIGSVKGKIHAKTEISPHQQVLKFNDKQLDDVHSLNYYGIENKSTLFLCVSVEILVRMTTGRDVMLNLFKSNTIKDVKERIQLSEDIPCHMQRLYFLCRRLRDNYTLSYYNIISGCFLQCDVLLIRINVKIPNEDVVSVDICPKDSVRSLMEIIQARGVIPPNQLSLVYNGEKLNNRFTLNHYKLRNGSLLNAEFKSGGTSMYVINETCDMVCNHPEIKHWEDRWKYDAQKRCLILWWNMPWENSQHFFTLLLDGFPGKWCMRNELKKFHTGDVSLPRSGYYFWLVEANFPRGTTNRKQYPDLRIAWFCYWLKQISLAGRPIKRNIQISLLLLIGWSKFSSRHDQSEGLIRFR